MDVFAANDYLGLGWDGFAYSESYLGYALSSWYMHQSYLGSLDD